LLARPPFGYIPHSIHPRLEPCWEYSAKPLDFDRASQSRIISCAKPPLQSLRLDERISGAISYAPSQTHTSSHAPLIPSHKCAQCLVADLRNKSRCEQPSILVFYLRSTILCRGTPSQVITQQLKSVLWGYLLYEHGPYLLIARHHGGLSLKPMLGFPRSTDRRPIRCKTNSWTCALSRASCPVPPAHLIYRVNYPKRMINRRLLCSGTERCLTPSSCRF
jgi:hypothetical protein